MEKIYLVIEQTSMGSGSSLDVLIGSLGPLDLQVLMDDIRNQPD